MKAVARSLTLVETSEPATALQLELAARAATVFRRERGIPDLVDDPEPSEEGFYRRARALGFRRIGR